MNIKQTNQSDAFQTMSRVSNAANENNDCAVKAIALTTGVGYEAARDACQRFGRKDRKGTHLSTMRDAINALGFKVERIPSDKFIERYPKSHRTLHNVTTHHPERFHKVWKDNTNYIVITATHAAAILNGRTHDWSEGRELRVNYIWKITTK